MSEQDESTTTGTGIEETTWLADWEQGPAEERRSGLHPLQTGYLVVGLLALGVALLWLLTEQGVVEVADGGIAFSVVLIIAGAVGLVASLGRALRN